MTTSWDEERTDYLKEIWPGGQSATITAGLINAKFHTSFTRNAIIGKVHREGLSLRGVRNPKGRLRSHGKRDPRQVMLRTTLQKINQNSYAREAREFEADDELLSIEARAAADVVGATMADLEQNDGRCRYPIGDPREASFGYCGKEAVGQYCTHHHARCMSPMPKHKPKTEAQVRENRAIFKDRTACLNSKLLEDA